MMAPPSVLPTSRYGRRGGGGGGGCRCGGGCSCGGGGCGSCSGSCKRWRHEDARVKGCEPLTSGRRWRSKHEATMVPKALRQHRHDRLQRGGCSLALLLAATPTLSYVAPTSFEKHPLPAQGFDRPYASHLMKVIGPTLRWKVTVQAGEAPKTHHGSDSHGVSKARNTANLLHRVAGWAKPVVGSLFLAAFFRILPAFAAVTGGRISGRNSESFTPSQPRHDHHTVERRSAGVRGGGVASHSGLWHSVSGASSSGGILLTREPSRRSRVVYDPQEAPAATEVTAKDVVVVAAVVGGILVYRYHYGAGSPMGPLEGPLPAVSVLQLSLFVGDNGPHARSILNFMRGLAGHADGSSPGGLAALVSEVCVALLRAEDDWVGVSASTQAFGADRQQGGGSGGSSGGGGDGGGRTGGSGSSSSSGGGSGTAAASAAAAAARNALNRAAVQERCKWQTEAVTGGMSADGSSKGRKSGRGRKVVARTMAGSPAALTFAVVTIVVAWSALGSHGGRDDIRGWGLWRRCGGRNDGAASPPPPKTLDTAREWVEWLSAAAAEHGGRNMMDVEVLWTPAEPGDKLSKVELDTKWPHLRAV